MVYGQPILYDESDNTHYFQDPQWLTINRPYSHGDGEYPFPHYEGINEYGE